ncbi:hypothetical protein P154DRAFT_78708 [Amniculicola lignicola CBS 123094]|uniref:Uncharacterized protein n=1 Tax=Amniculicola lignicola CBS 123094 TaxID=1392246 RepID=A0A6A5WPX0_9PLEO|nr:hypothetical protein P154DRAFT_78708 [Amniculicola lignicola CBS 123094]
MSPIIDMALLSNHLPVLSARKGPPTRSGLDEEGGFLEAWAQGYNVGSLIILILIVFCNYRAGILLHKLILLELVLALWHGTFIFFEDPVYGWYLSSTAALLFVSYQLHNVVSWLKIRPFLPTWGSRLFIFSLLAVQPFWIAEAWSNFEYFNSLGSTANVKMRPWEALVRDPWWIYTTWKLTQCIKESYGFKLRALVKINSRFGVMLVCMFISIAFLLTDVLVSVLRVTKNSGINPYWRCALVFKCASDTIFLDDFKSVLDDIVERKFSNGSDRAQHSGARRRKQSEHGYTEFITLGGCGPSTHVSSSNKPSLFRMINPFATRNEKKPVPSIRVQQETTVTTKQRQGTHEVFGSEDVLLPKPPAAICGNSLDNGRSGSVLIGPGDYPV